jgi:hypothetical protein
MRYVYFFYYKNSHQDTKSPNFKNKKFLGVPLCLMLRSGATSQSSIFVS